MRRWKAWIAGALALAGLATVQSEAQARTMTPPQLTPLHAAQTEPAASVPEPTCYWRHGYRHYGWRRHYGFHRRYYGWHRRYGYYRPRHYRPVHYGWHRHYGWRRW